MSDPIVEMAKIVTGMYGHVLGYETSLDYAWEAFNVINREHPHFLGECQDLIKEAARVQG